MTPDDRFDGTVSVFLQQRAGTGAPDYLDDILGRTARTRQRPGWLSIERWPPMDISANRTALPSRFPTRALVLFAILALLLAAVVAVGVGSRQQRVPAPFGPAANGLIAYGVADGDIHVFDPSTGPSRPLVDGPRTRRDAGLLARTERSSSSPDEVSRSVDVVPHGRQRRRHERSSADGRRHLPGESTPGRRTVSGSRSSNSFAGDATVDGLLRRRDATGRISRRMDVSRLAWRSDDGARLRGTRGRHHGLYVVGIDGSRPRPILPESGVDVDWIDARGLA